MNQFVLVITMVTVEVASKIMVLFATFKACLERPDS